MEGDAAGDEETPLESFPSILSDADTQIPSLESNDIGLSFGLESSLMQTGQNRRTVTRQGVSPFALLQTTVSNFVGNDDSIALPTVNYGSISSSSPIQELRGSPNAATSRRRRTSETYRVYGLKHEVSEILWDGDPHQASANEGSISILMAKLNALCAPLDLNSLEIAAYRIRDGVMAERIYPCSHPNALSDPKSKRWKNRNPQHIDKFFEAKMVTELIREGEGGVALLEGTLACASPCWKCTERLQRFVLVKDGKSIAFTAIIGVQASRARTGRPRKGGATTESSSAGSNT